MSRLPPEWDAQETLRQRIIDRHLRSWVGSPQKVTTEHYQQAFVIAQQELTSLEQARPGRSWVEMAQDRAPNRNKHRCAKGILGWISKQQSQKGACQ